MEPRQYDLGQKKCLPCEGGIAVLSADEANDLLAQVSGWEIVGIKLIRQFLFKNHYEASAFVNAIVFVSHKENHHPYITFGFKDVRVEYWTHAVDGLTENDFICATKVNKLLED